jgi:hypothetical protein
MRSIFALILVLLVLFNNYTFEEIKYAFNYYAGWLFPSNPGYGITLIIIGLIIYTFLDEIRIVIKWISRKIKLK